MNNIFELLGTQEITEGLEYLRNYKSTFPQWVREENKIIDKLGENELFLDLILGMLEVPDKRLSIYECINHPWIMS